MKNKMSIKDRRRAVALSMLPLAYASDKTPPEIPEGSVRRGPNKPRAEGAPKREAEVQQAIIDWLLDSPHVAMVERINSGAMQDGHGNFVRFNVVMIPARLRPIGSIQRVRRPDLSVLLTDGKRMEIEVKREGWKLGNDIREREQENYLAHIRRFGCIGIFATSVKDVKTAMVVHGYA
jgi:hypothetical protein